MEKPKPKKATTLTANAFLFRYEKGMFCMFIVVRNRIHGQHKLLAHFISFRGRTESELAQRKRTHVVESVLKVHATAGDSDG